MKLTEIQKRNIAFAVKNFIKYCADCNSSGRKTSEEAVDAYNLASDHFSSVIELVLDKDYGDSYIEEQLHLGEWTSPEEVVAYIESEAWKDESLQVQFAD